MGLFVSISERRNQHEAPAKGPTRLEIHPFFVAGTLSEPKGQHPILAAPPFTQSQASLTESNVPALAPLARLRALVGSSSSASSGSSGSCKQTWKRRNPPSWSTSPFWGSPFGGPLWGVPVWVSDLHGSKRLAWSQTSICLRRVWSLGPTSCTDPAPSWSRFNRPRDGHWLRTVCPFD